VWEDKGKKMRREKKKKKKKETGLVGGARTRTHETSVHILALMRAAADLLAVKLLAARRRSRNASAVHCVARPA
jgi:hypothetical protein